MRHLLPQALPVGRLSAIRCPASQATLAQRFSSLLPTAQTASATFKAHAGYRTNPNARPVNPNAKDKIPESKRQIKRPFVPPPSKTPEQLAALPYVVRRTPYAQLPIYKRFMSGGNRTLILIKKVDGDRRGMVEDLAKALELERTDIRLNPTTQHIEIKGNHYGRAIDWLLQSGF